MYSSNQMQNVAKKVLQIFNLCISDAESESKLKTANYVERDPLFSLIQINIF